LSSSIATTTSGLSSSISSLSSSFTETDEDQEDRISVIESRYATTGSNIFKGDQTITGSLYVSQNLIVQGSSSLENITASAVSIGTNTIILNADTPAIRYAGISVFDSGSTNVTASLFYDSLTNNWKFKHSDVGTDDASILLYGPLGTGIDNAPTLDGNFLTKVENNGHGHHLTTSSIFDNGSKVSINSNSEITGSLTVTGVIRSTTTPLVSGSDQINHNTTTNYVANQHIDHTTVSISPGSGLTGGGTIAATRTLSIATGGVTNAMLAGSIENGKLSNSSLTIGTTAISLGSSSTTLGGLTSVTSTAFTGSLQGNISGNAVTVTNGVYTTGDQTIAGIKTFSSTIVGSINGNAATSTTVTGTNIGSISGPLSTTTSQAGWVQPSGFNKMITASGSNGLPTTGAASAYYGYTVLSRRDADSGYSGILIGYNNDEMWFTYNPVGTNYATWKRVIHEGNLGAITTVGTITSGTWNGTTIAIANGGTGATTAAAARTNLGLVIGTDVLAQRTFGTAANNNTGDFAAFNATHYVGTTAITANRASASQTLTGVSIDGNAATATSADQIDSIGFRNTNTSGVAANTLDSNGITYVTNVDGSSTNLTGNSTDGALYSQYYSSDWQHQIYGDYRTGIMYVRGKNNNTWQSWKRVALSNSTTFSNVSSVTFTHTLGTANLTAQVFDTNGDMFFPSNIRITATQVILTFSTNRSGRLVVTG
jgi:hypothetical protein